MSLDYSSELEKKEDEEDDDLICGWCCKKTRELIPARIENPAGLSSLIYRIGTFATFKESMLASISSAENALSRLTTRSDDDFIIALIDAWSMVLDVLTFYQERIATEGFLRTATERISILELARTIGYELGPGVAASTFLAFNLEVDPDQDAQRPVLIKKLTKVQSLPAQGQMPQVFETIEDLVAWPEWNELKPRLTELQHITKDTSTFYFNNLKTPLKAGDGLLVFLDEPSNDALFMIVLKSELIDPKLKITKVNTIPTVIPADTPNIVKSKSKESITFEAIREVITLFGKGIQEKRNEENAYRKSIFGDKETNKKVTSNGIDNIRLNKFSYEDLVTLAIINEIPRRTFFKLFNIKARELARKSVPKAKVYCFRTRAALFGHNAPQFEVLPAEIQGSPIQPWKWYNDLDMDIQHYPKENCATIKKIYLDNIYSNILPNSWIVLLSNDLGSKSCFVSGVTEISLADFLINAKITALMLKEDNTIPAYKLRETTVFAESEELELTDEVPLPLDDSSSLSENGIILNHVIDGLNIGQPVSIKGELQGIPQINNEIAIIKSIDIIIHNDNPSYTKLTFEEKLKHNYKQYTVSINANVADATHGETKNDILGSGDPSQRQQKFTLKEIPLTFVSAPTTKGSKSTLTIRINSILWKETSYLYNLRSNDHAYILRLDNDGTPHITFGEGIHGAKPPSGIENIEAEYRVGIGEDGMLGKNQLTLLMNKPLGVKSVTNPIEPTGAEDPEDLDNARQNAPLTILTMERLVSPLDFENFALGFGGIGKAQALVLWNGEKKRIIHLTVGSVFGDPVESNSDLYKNLKKAIDTHKDQSIPYQLSTFTKKLFSLKANVVVESDRMTEDMISKIEMSLRNKFSYFSRNFGQSVMKSEVIVAIQQVEGVILVDLDHLYDSTPLALDNNTKENYNNNNLKQKEKLVESIPSSLAHWESIDNKFSKSELLIIHPDSGDNAIKINVTIQGEDRL